MNVFIDPTPVGYDSGYSMFMDHIELWTRRRLELNLSRYVRIAWWSSTLGIIPNAEFIYNPGKATIWIRAFCPIKEGEIIWVQPPPGMQFGMHPVTMFWNPPFPNGTNACSYPKHWEHIIVECLPDNLDFPIDPAQRLSWSPDWGEYLETN